MKAKFLCLVPFLALSPLQAQLVIGTGDLTPASTGSSPWNVGGDLMVGNTGTGDLQILNGGEVYSATGYIGTLSGSVGTVEVNGLGSLLENTGDLWIGDAGSGTLTLDNGGSVEVGSGNVWIADKAGSTGTLNFGAYDLTSPTTTGTLNATKIAFGAGTGLINFNQTDTLTLSASISGNGKLVQRGTGTTILTGSNTLTSAATTVNQGTLVVDGAAARLMQTSGDLGVGIDSGENGSFIVRNGAHVSNVNSYLGRESGSVGSALVTGENSFWENTNALFVGYKGVGELTLEDDAAISTGITSIGHERYSSGTVTINGGTFTDSGELWVGNLGTGTLIINGGIVTSSNVNIGRDRTFEGSGNIGEGGSNGFVTINDGVLTTTGNIYVGDKGYGTLTLAGGIINVGGGTVQMGNNYYGRGTLNFGAYDLSNATGSGTLNASAIVAGSKKNVINFNQNDTLTLGLTISGPIELHQRGTGTTILTGSVDISGQSDEYVVDTSTSVQQGKLVVQGPSASLVHTNNNLAIATLLGVDAAMEIRGGATVRNKSGYVGKEASSTGSMLVTGPGSLWENTDTLYVGGDYGVGRLTIEDSGTVTAGLITIGATIPAYAFAPSIVTVNDGTLTSAGEVRVGDSGTGQLILNNGTINGTIGNIARGLVSLR